MHWKCASRRCWAWQTVCTCRGEFSLSGEDPHIHVNVTLTWIHRREGIEIRTDTQTQSWIWLLVNIFMALALHFTCNKQDFPQSDLYLRPKQSREDKNMNIFRQYWMESIIVKTEALIMYGHALRLPQTPSLTAANSVTVHHSEFATVLFSTEHWKWRYFSRKFSTCPALLSHALSVAMCTRSARVTRSPVTFKGPGITVSLFPEYCTCGCYHGNGNLLTQEVLVSGSKSSVPADEELSVKTAPADMQCIKKRKFPCKISWSEEENNINLTTNC